MTLLEYPKWRLDLLRLVEPGVRAKVGRLPARDFSLAFAIGQPVTIGLNVRNDSTLVSYVEEMRSYIKAYRTPAGVLPNAPGDLIAYNVIGDCQDTLGADGAVAVTALDPQIYLQRRKFDARYQVTARRKDLIIQDWLDAENVKRATRIEWDSESDELEETDLDIPAFRYVHESMLDLGKSGDGLEWEVAPIDSETGDFGSLRVASALGEVRTDVSFEHGRGRQNIASGNTTSTVGKLTTAQFVFGSSTGEGEPSPGGQVVDTDLEDYYDAKLESVDTFADVNTPDVMQAIADRMAAYRSAPRRVLTFTPNDQPGIAPFDDFNLGDVIGATIYDGRQAIDGSVRVWGFTIGVRTTGEETLTSMTIEPQ